jgi:hypothetical protein
VSHFSGATRLTFHPPFTTEEKTVWLSGKEAYQLLADLGLRLSQRSVERLTYSGDLESMRPLPRKLLISESSLRAYVAKIKGDAQFWEGRDPIPQRKSETVSPNQGNSRG